MRSSGRNPFPASLGLIRTLLAGLALGLAPAAIAPAAQADLGELRARAEKGDGTALNELGNAYAHGQGVTQDLAEALRLYGLAADGGVASAMFNIGMMHELGRGVPANAATAFQFYERAAKRGFAPAQFNVANMYANGIGVKTDYFEAALWFRQAADRNIPEAQYNLALAYELGRGVVKNEAAALRWYRAAAAQNFARAQFNLALMLETGRGAPSNPAQALELYRAAATQNFLPAQNNLGLILAESGDPAALVEAYVWLALAVENGGKPTGRDLVAQKLTPEQLAEAQLALAKRREQLSLSDRPAITEPIVVPPVPPSVSPARDPSAGVKTDPGIAANGELDQLKKEISRLTAAAEAAALEKKKLEQKLAAGESRFISALEKSTAAEAHSKAATAARISAESEREKLAQQLADSKAALDAARAKAETATAEIARLQSAAPPEAAAPPREYSALLTQLERLTREAATLRTEKADLTRRLSELTAELAGSRTTANATAVTTSADTRFIPLQELAAADRRIAKLIADNTRLQEHVKKSVAELTELSRQLVTPEPRTERSAPAPR